MSKLTKRDEELSELKKSFQDADIDPSNRKSEFEAVRPLIDAVSDALRKAKIPFGMVFDLSTAEELADDKSEPYIDIFTPDGPVIMSVCDISNMFKDDETILEQLCSRFSAENIRQASLDHGKSEFPDIPVLKWFDEVHNGKTLLGYWEFVSFCVIESAKEEIQEKMKGIIGQE